MKPEPLSLALFPSDGARELMLEPLSLALSPSDGERRLILNTLSSSGWRRGIKGEEALP